MLNKQVNKIDSFCNHLNHIGLTSKLLRVDNPLEIISVGGNLQFTYSKEGFYHFYTTD